MLGHLERDSDAYLPSPPSIVAAAHPGTNAMELIPPPLLQGQSQATPSPPPAAALPRTASVRRRRQRIACIAAAEIVGLGFMEKGTGKETEWRRRPRAGPRPGQMPVDTALLYASMACRWAQAKAKAIRRNWQESARGRIAMVNFKIVEL